jgi:hypothetical protein
MSFSGCFNSISIAGSNYSLWRSLPIRSVSPELVDYSRIEAMIRQSDGESHWIPPKHVKKRVDKLDLRLIDVENLCITRGKLDDKYVALSYVWYVQFMEADLFQRKSNDN